jgi:cytochrome c-type biogenesis protein CcmE
MTRKQRRFASIGGIGTVLAVAGGLTLYALANYIDVFRTPSMVFSEKIAAGIPFRLGGMVQRGSLKPGTGTGGHFVIIDCLQQITVTYDQILPDLFREGQYAVAEGALDQAGAFVSTSVLARHDENYVPRDVADEMRKQGHSLDSVSCSPSKDAPKTATNAVDKPS